LTSSPTEDRLLTAVRNLYRMLTPCRVCPRHCGADRLGGRRGACRAALSVELASATVHHGEEPPISGTHGSGTLFFSHCTLSCRFCQNWPISQTDVGRTVTIGELADRMLALQRKGVHNINLVNPTHYWPQIAAAVAVARARGLRVPVLANSSGFESVETLAHLGDVVQIWLPDYKTTDPAFAEEICGRADLPKVSWSALDFLVKLAGPLRVGEDGVATHGVLVRHLVLPGGRSRTPRVLRRVHRRFRGRVPVSLMTQYFPAYKAPHDPVFGHGPTRGHKRRVTRLARTLGHGRGWRQRDG